MVQPQAGAGPGPVINSVAYLLATGSESVANISAEYVTNTGVAPNGVDVTAAISELVSGVPLVYQQLEAAELSGGAAPTFSGANSVITPQTIAGSTPRYVYSLGNDDAIVSPNATLGVELEAATHQGDSVVGFNPATDFLQFHGAQALQNGTVQHKPAGDQRRRTVDAVRSGNNRHFEHWRATADLQRHARPVVIGKLRRYRGSASITSPS